MEMRVFDLTRWRAVFMSANVLGASNEPRTAHKSNIIVTIWIIYCSVSQWYSNHVKGYHFTICSTIPYKRRPFVNCILRNIIDIWTKWTIYGSYMNHMRNSYKKPMQMISSLYSEKSLQEVYSSKRWVRKVSNYICPSFPSLASSKEFSPILENNYRFLQPESVAKFQNETSTRAKWVNESRKTSLKGKECEWVTNNRNKRKRELK